jgi:hypothetical protein
LENADLSLSNSLVDLAARIRTEHDGAKAAVKRCVEHAIAAGEFLIEAKAQLKHGQWLPWLQERCGLNERTARRYMRVAKNKDKLGENGHVSDLSLRGAIDALTVHLPPEEPVDDAAAVLKVLSENFDRLPPAAVEALREVAAKAMEEEKLSYLDAIEYVEENPTDGYPCFACLRETKNKGFFEAYVLAPFGEILWLKRGIREDCIEDFLTRQTNGRLSPSKWDIRPATNRVFNAYAEIYNNASDPSSAEARQ